jgi:hypothetical protein
MTFGNDECQLTNVELRRSLRSIIDNLKLIEFLNSSFDNRHSTFLELARFQLFTEKANLFFYRAVLFDTALNAVYGMQYGGVIAVK